MPELADIGWFAGGFGAAVLIGALAFFYLVSKID